MTVLTDFRTGRRETVTWLDLDRYAHTVFAGSAPGWYADPARLAGAVGQARRLLGSHVVGVDLTGPFLSRLDHTAAAGGVAAVLDLLGEAGPARIARETVAAVAHDLTGPADLVLVCWCPADLLRRAGRAPESGPADFDDLDDVGAQLLAVLRGCADLPVAGVLLRRTGAPGADEPLAWAPLLAAAVHYGWTTALSIEGVDSAAGLPAGLGTDLVLLPDAPAARIPADRRHGGGLCAAFWTGRPDDGPDLPALRFGRVPPDLPPEQVLRMAASLTGEGNRR